MLCDKRTESDRHRHVAFLNLLELQNVATYERPQSSPGLCPCLITLEVLTFDALRTIL